MKGNLEKNLVLKAVAEGQIIGSVRAYSQDRTCFIGRLIADPGCQNHGIGTRLMKEIEGRFASVCRYELFTGDGSARNLHLYQKLGYRPFRTQQVTGKVTIVYLEKVREG